ncbi:MAG TPA: molybdopterin molybdenumtransferase MoeA, partial [Verrucomicrobiae bacterium]|nr:molybdopterin molybdenumtransferase MoeA [Verrucomicrobiae bacterium]
MLKLEEAVVRILEAIPAPKRQSVALNAADRRVLLDRLTAPIDLPPFDNSGMDGYAVRAADVALARPETPVCLHLSGRVPAGENFSGDLAPGSCIRLFTGSP